MVYLNGKFLPIEEARVPVLDRGFIFGDGVYELVPVYSRVPFRLVLQYSPFSPQPQRFSSWASGFRSQALR